MFVHAGLLHLLGNMLMLFVFGPPVEHRMGGRAFLLYYLYCGIGAAVLSLCALGDPAERGGPVRRRLGRGAGRGRRLRHCSGPTPSCSSSRSRSRSRRGPSSCSRGPRRRVLADRCRTTASPTWRTSAARVRLPLLPAAGALAAEPASPAPRRRARGDGAVRLPPSRSGGRRRRRIRPRRRAGRRSGRRRSRSRARQDQRAGHRAASRPPSAASSTRSRGRRSRSN